MIVRMDDCPASEPDAIRPALPGRGRGQSRPDRSGAGQSMFEANECEDERSCSYPVGTPSTCPQGPSSGEPNDVRKGANAPSGTRVGYAGFGGADRAARAAPLRLDATQASPGEAAGSRRRTAASHCGRGHDPARQTARCEAASGPPAGKGLPRRPLPFRHASDLSARADVRRAERCAQRCERTERHEGRLCRGGSF